MYYRKNFKKYQAFRLQQEAELNQTDAHIVDVGITPETLFEELRRRFPEFYRSKY